MRKVGAGLEVIPKNKRTNTALQFMNPNVQKANDRIKFDDDAEFTANVHLVCQSKPLK